MHSEKSKLIFVYNADSGVFNLLGDMAHKIFSPATYSCNLCAITHGNFGMKNDWREYLKTVRVPFEFLHADEFKERFQVGSVRFPAAFKEEKGAVEMIISADEINRCRTMEDLKRLIDREIDSQFPASESRIE